MAIVDGNVTPSAEFNIWVDPEAAAIVFGCGRPITMVPLEVTHQALATEEIVHRLRDAGGTVPRFAADLLVFFAESYRQAFSEIEELELPPSAPTNGEHAWHLFILRIRPDLLTVSRTEFIDQLRKAGIGASVHFIPLHLHPFYCRTYGYRPP